LRCGLAKVLFISFAFPTEERTLTAKEQRHSNETFRATELLDSLIAEADQRPPHIALDSLLIIAERTALQQGGRLSDLQTRVFAALLLGAAKLPAELADPKIQPEWLTAADRQWFYTPRVRKSRDNAGHGWALTRH
jgi:hypothetical protein